MAIRFFLPLIFRALQIESGEQWGVGADSRQQTADIRQQEPEIPSGKREKLHDLAILSEATRKEEQIYSYLLRNE